MPPKVDMNVCTGAGDCFDVCTGDPNVFEITDGKAHVVSAESCIDCGACDGTSSNRKSHIVIHAHGSRTKKFREEYA